jgi:hypothetical protein
VNWEDDEQELTHLQAHNTKLKGQMKRIKLTMRELKGGELSAQDEASAEELKAQNESYEADIETWKEKARASNDIALLDTLADDLVERKLHAKALKLQLRQLGDHKRENLKVLNHTGDAPSRQKVFLNLKDEKRRLSTRLDGSQDRKESLAEQITYFQKKADDAMASVAALGLTNVDYASVVNMQKQDVEQKKQIEKLQSQIHIATTSFSSTKTRTQWLSRDKQVVIDDIRQELEKVLGQINAKEQLIMSNQGMMEKPPHFVAPLSPRVAEPAPLPSPRPKPKAKPVAKKEKKEIMEPHPPPPKKAKPAPPPKKAVAPTKPKAAKKERTPTPPTEANPRRSPSPVNSEKLNELDNVSEKDNYSDDEHVKSRSPTPIAARTPSPSPARSPSPVAARTPSPGPAPVEDEVGYDEDYASPSPAKKDQPDVVDEEVADEPAFLTE